MNNFELYKLKKAGLKNHHILNIIHYSQQTKKSLSLRNMAVVSGTSKPCLFLENYKLLNIKELRVEFKKYPSFSILDKTYPLALKEIDNPPVLLFYQGNLELLNRNKLAVVGSRKSSAVGNKSVESLIKQLNNQFVIVSGLARGIDTVAHFSSIKQGGETIAVIGSGLDIYYPKENRRLQEFIAEKHLLLSEYCPKEAPLAHHFPERNRIIAGLSMGVLVAEAKWRSGSLITCRFALDYGRDIFVVPGAILDKQSQGGNHLIQEGSKLVTKGLDIISEYQFL